MSDDETRRRFAARTRSVLDDWRASADPVDGFRRAVDHFSGERRSDAHAGGHRLTA
jgi:hypothetical protein